MISEVHDLPGAYIHLIHTKHLIAKNQPILIFLPCNEISFNSNGSHL